MDPSDSTAAPAQAQIPNQKDRTALFGDEEFQKFCVMATLGKRPLSCFLQLELVPRRFIFAATSALALIVAFMAVFLKGIVIVGEVYDPIGSSTNAKAQMELYQTVLGYIMAFLDILRDQHFGVFMPVFVTYLANLRWFPKDRPRETTHQVKKFALFWFVPVLAYVIGVGFSSIFVADRTIGIRRVFLDTDLKAEVLRPKNATNVEETILRTAVLRRAEPFKLMADSPCKTPGNSGMATKSSSASGDEELQEETVDFAAIVSYLSTVNSAVDMYPTVSEVEQTSVVYGFPLKDWNFDLLPKAVTPRQKLNFTIGQYQNSSKSIDKQFATFQNDSNLDFATIYDLVLQGKIMMERSTSMGTTMTYACTAVDGRDDLDQVPTNSIENDEQDDEWERDSNGTRWCRGAASTLGAINQTARAHRTLGSFLDTFKDLLTITDPDAYHVAFEVSDLSPWVQVSSLTIDFPIGTAGNFSGDFYSQICHKANITALPPKIFEQLCSQENYVYDGPPSMCGSTSCVFMDFFNTISLSRELLMFPFQSNCSTARGKLWYDHEYGNWFPSDCAPRNNSMFMYGFGTYVAGERFTNGVHDHILPQLVKPRRHAVVTFAKLDWKYDDMATLFGAKCTAKPNCDGLVHALADGESFLLVGESSLPEEIVEKDFMDPIRLVTLNTKTVDYKDGTNEVEWEYVDKSRFQSSDWSKNNTLQGDRCSMLLDSYIHHLEVNHYYLDEPLQPLYTSAMYYLFQNAAVKYVNSSTTFQMQNATTKAHGAIPTNAAAATATKVLAVLSLSGDREIKQVVFSVPLGSAIVSFVGLGILLVLTVVMLMYPQEQLQLPNGPTVASKFIKSLTEEEYPEQVHRRLLRVPNTGEEVDTEDFSVESIRLYHVRDADKTIHL